MNNIEKSANIITEKYRVESGSVYEYSEEHRAYIFIGKLNGRTKKQFIADYEFAAE